LPERKSARPSLLKSIRQQAFKSSLLAMLGLNFFDISKEIVLHKGNKQAMKVESKAGRIIPLRKSFFMRSRLGLIYIQDTCQISAELRIGSFRSIPAAFKHHCRLCADDDLGLNH